MTQWKTFVLLIPQQLSQGEIATRIHEQIRLNATEAGDFVHEIRFSRTHTESGGQRWTIAYRPGPPAPFLSLSRCRAAVVAACESHSDTVAPPSGFA